MKKLNVKVLALVLVFSLFVTIAGCSNSKSDKEKPEGEDKKAVVGVLVKTQSDPFQRKVNEAVSEKLDELKKDGKIGDYIELNGESDVQKQLNQADDLIARKVDIIIMAPQDADGCAPIVEKAKEANIPIIVLNSKTNNVEEATTFVGSDDVDAGRIMGNYVIDRLEGKGKVVQLEGTIGNSAQIGRNQGLLDTLYQEPGIEKLEVLTAKWQRDEAMRITEDWLQKYQQIDAICAENDDMAIGAMNAVKNAGRKNEIIIIGVDAIDDALSAVKDGDMDATIFQDASGQGVKAVEVALDIINGKEVEKNHMIPFILITKDNADEYIK